jgi:co-chaperonin GroES (HSP10)
MAIKPAGHRVLVLPDPIEEVSEGGIIMVTSNNTDREKQAQMFGTVVDIGYTAWKDFGGGNWCSVGDRIAFAKYGGFIIKDPADGKEYRLLNDEDVCAVVTGE